MRSLSPFGGGPQYKKFQCRRRRKRPIIVEDEHTSKTQLCDHDLAFQLSLERLIETRNNYFVSAPAEPRVRKLTVEDYYLLAREGHLDPSERTELVDGQIISMLPIGFSHSDVQARLLTQLYRQQDLPRFRVWPGGLRISDTGERYPDISLVRPGLTEQPSPADLFLLIEIADSSLTYDLTEKRDEYEQVGVPEYWVVDVRNKTVFVFQMEHGRYVSLGAKNSGVLPVHAFPELTISIADLF